jgi:hypothetical protein
MLAQPGCPPVLYFVDGNFIGNRKAAREMLPRLVAWQRKKHYPLRFACEATLKTLSFQRVAPTLDPNQ